MHPLIALLCCLPVILFFGALWFQERLVARKWAAYATNVDNLVASLKAELNRQAAELEVCRSQLHKKGALDKLDEWHKADPDHRYFTTCESHTYLEDYSREEAVTYAVRKPSYMAANSVLPAGATEESPASSSDTVLAAIAEWDRRKLALQQPKPVEEVT